MTSRSDEYKSKFIDISFDTILLQHNNPLSNSYKYYIQHKENYINETEELFKSFQSFDSELKRLLELQQITISPFKKLYTFIDNKRVDELKQSMKILYLQQQNKLKNFLIYIDYLNKNHHNIKVDEENIDAENDEYIQDYTPKRPASIRSIQSVKSVKSIESKKRTPSIKSVDSTKRRKNIFSKLVSRREI